MRRAVIPALLVSLVLAGCGATPRLHRAAPPKLPSALAAAWAGQANDIATALQDPHGDCHHAQQAAASLAAEVDNSSDQIPPRLRTPLLQAVKTLSSRITCTPKPKPKPPKKHGHEHGHGPGGDH